MRLMPALARNRRGVAMLEFAFVLPIFVSLMFVGAECVNYIIARMRIGQIALALADNAARIGTGTQLQAKTISEQDINDLLTGAGYQAGTMELYERGRVVISSVEPTASPNTAMTYKVGWQRCQGAKAYVSPYYPPRTNIPVGIGPPGQKVTAPDNGATMFVEVAYDYRPLIATPLSPSGQIVEFASMVVRDRRDVTAVYNSEGAPVRAC